MVKHGGTFVCYHVRSRTGFKLTFAMGGGYKNILVIQTAYLIKLIGN